MPISISDNTWAIWVQDCTITNTTQIWTGWVAATAATNFNVTANSVYVDQPTAEELERRQLQHEEYEAARAKAREFLLAHLTPKQRAEFERAGHFHVETAEGRRRYLLRPGSAPVRVQGEDGRRWSYCIHPREPYPAEDVALALKLMLETDEEAFLQIANASVA